MKELFLPLYVHGVNDVRQTEIHTAEPLVPETSSFETELAIKKQQSHESPDIYQIRAELIKAGVKQFTTRSIILLFIFGIWRNCLSSGAIRTLYLSKRRAINRL